MRGARGARPPPRPAAAGGRVPGVLCHRRAPGLPCHARPPGTASPCVPTRGARLAPRPVSTSAPAVRSRGPDWEPPGGRRSPGGSRRRWRAAPPVGLGGPGPGGSRRSTAGPPARRSGRRQAALPSAPGAGEPSSPAPAREAPDRRGATGRREPQGAGARGRWAAAAGPTAGGDQPCDGRAPSCGDARDVGASAAREHTLAGDGATRSQAAECSPSWAGSRCRVPSRTRAGGAERDHNGAWTGAWPREAERGGRRGATSPPG